MTNIINLEFPKCCECGVRANHPGNPEVDEIVRRRFGSAHSKPCNRPEIITCAMSECQYANLCVLAEPPKKKKRA